MLDVQIGPLQLKNPVMSASGTFGHSLEMESFVDFSGLGALVLKTVTPRPRPGNAPPRLFETASGLMNSIGLENHGVDAFLAEELPKLEACPSPVVANIGGESLDEFQEVAEKVAPHPRVDAIEVNLSCPNVQGGKLLFSSTPEGAEDVLKRVRQTTKKPLLAKLSPNVTNIGEIAKGAEAAGADAVTAVNTVLALAVDWRTRKTRLGAGFGGLSGPAIKPIALRQVFDCYRAVKIPVIGCGGAASAEDVLEFLVAGATAVQVGTWNYVEPGNLGKMAADLTELCKKAGVSRLSELTGTLEFPRGPAQE